MSKCLVTKLNGTVTNEDLLHLGGFKFKIRNTAGEGHNFKIATVNSVVDVYASSPITINGVKTTSLKAQSEVVITPSVGNEYTTIEVVGKNAVNKFGYLNNLGLNPDDVIDFTIDKYFTGLSQDWMLWFNGTPTMNLQEVKTNYLGEKVGCKNITGNIANPSMVTLFIDDAIGLYGDISGMTSLTGRFSTGKNDKNIYGSINALTSLTRIYSNDAVLSGDLSKLSHLQYVQTGPNSVFTFSDKNSNFDVITAFGSVYFQNGTDVDNLLQCLASKNKQNGAEYIQRLSIYTKDGSNRTSASDSAVSTLKEKGITIIVNNVNL